LISLGKIVKVRGNKGEVVLCPSPGDGTSVPKKGESVLLKSSKYQKTYQIEYIEEISGATVLKLKSINSISQALRLVGYTLFISSLSKEHISPEGITGFTVKDVSGEYWGEITKVEITGLMKILEIRDNHDDVIYVPIDETIVKEIDEKERTVIIDPPGGLKELNK
jgi:16S rRNA processing protein RimM